MTPPFHGSVCLHRATEDHDPVALPLSAMQVGQEVVLAGVNAGRRLQLRLTEMGLMPGVAFRILNRGRPGPFIIAIKGCRLVLGHGLVNRILVRSRREIPATHERK